jgi:signal transduction histidine kinase
MPNRIIREGILSSDRVEQLDPAAEVFYRRLMSKVDDHGLFDGRVSMLRTSLYPLRVDRVREADISRWIAACEKAGLIALYQHDGKPYLQMLDTRWQARSEAKYPLPTAPESALLNTAASNCAQPLSTAPVFGVEGVVEDEGEKARTRATPSRRAKPVKTQLPDNFAISGRVEAWAAEKGFDRLGEHLEAFVRKCKAKAYEYADFDLAFMEAVREDWAKLRGRTPNGAAPPSTDDAEKRARIEHERSQRLLREQAEHAAEVERQRLARKAAAAQREAA